MQHPAATVIFATPCLNQQPGSKFTGTWVLRRHSYFWVRPYGVEEF